MQNISIDPLSNISLIDTTTDTNNIKIEETLELLIPEFFLLIYSLKILIREGFIWIKTFLNHLII